MEYIQQNPLIFSMLFALMAVVFIFNVFEIIKALVLLITNKIKHKLLFNKKMKKVKEMKARGELHDWVVVKFLGNPIYVCKKTGYCPSINGFFDTKTLSFQIEYEETIKKFEEFKERELEKISLKYNIGYNSLISAIKDVDNIKIDFVKQEKASDKKEK